MRADYIRLKTTRPDRLNFGNAETTRQIRWRDLSKNSQRMWRSLRRLFLQIIILLKKKVEKKKQQRNVSGSGGQNQKTASNENEACSDGDKTESVEKADQFGGNSSDENNEKKGASEENIDDENENEKKLETRAKVVLETTGERIVVRVSEIIERRE